MILKDVMPDTHYQAFTRLFSSLLLLTVLYSGKAQNLVPNYSFETVSPCPTAPGGWGPTVAPPWIGPTLGTPDIFHTCGSGPGGVPDNFAGTQYPNTGDGYAGLYVRVQNTEYREYLQALLLEPLEANKFYTLSFYVSMAEFGCATEFVGAYVSVDAPNGGFSNNYLDEEPQVESTQGYLTESEGWIYVSGCFSAEGGEQFITIGNFHPDSETPILQPCFNNLSYYYIDDVILEEVTGDGDIPLDLGGPEVACESYTIDPGYSGYYYTWEDGSHGTTLTVSETGVYSLTINDGCSFGIDSIEIFIHGQEPVDLPEDVVICEGESFTISLDPNFNEYEWNDGSTDAEYTITTSGTYSVTLDDGCVVSSDEITVDVISSPEPFDLGDDQYLCFGDELEYSFDPELGEFLWQDFSSSSTYIIDSDGTYSLTISNQCGSETDAIVVTLLESPEVNIGPDTSHLCNGETLEIIIDPGPGDISWQDGSGDSPYYISTAGIYNVIVTNMCGSASDEMEVFVADTPIVDFGLDTILCNTNPLFLTAHVAGGNFHWQDNSTNDTLVVTGPGTYALTVDNFCGTDTDTITVAYGTPVVQPDFGPDIDLCPGDQVILYANNPGAAIVWQDASAADSLIVTAPGTYAVMVSNSCGMATDTITITMNGTPPQVDLPDQLILCQGQATTLDAGITGVAYVWNDNSSGQQLSVSTPGTYSLTVSNGCGSDQDTTIILDGGPAPAVSLGGDVDLCPGDILIITPVSSDVSAWLWQDGSTMPSFTISGPGIITVEAGNSCGLAYDTLNVTLLPAIPALDLGPDTSLCSGESFMLSISEPGVTILWSDGSADPDFMVTSPGSYAATISNSCGQSSDTIVVNALPDIPILNLGPNQPLCPGEIISLSPGISGVDFLWHDGSTANTYQATIAETVSLTISNACGTSSDTVEIMESTQGPQLDLGPDIRECAGTIVTIPSGISGVEYLWQDGSTGPEYITAQSGQFILQVSNNCGISADTILVDISGVPPAPSLGPDTAICEGNTLILASGADSETIIFWQDGSSGQSYAVSVPGTYILSESNRCGDASDTIIITHLDAPDPFSLGPDTTLCPGESILLSSPSSFYDVLWQDGSGMLHLIADQPGTYSLQLSNDCGAESDEIIIDVDTRIPVIQLDSSISWCSGEIITLDASQPFQAGYSWSTGATSPGIEITSPGVYTIEISTPCRDASHSVAVFTDPDCENPDEHNAIYIPNVFSPNGDGINDVFEAGIGSALQILSMEGSVYDRWGNLVYGSKATPFSWDGFFDGEVLMPGVFVYTLKVSYLDNGVEREKVFAGDVTLLR